MKLILSKVDKGTRIYYSYGYRVVSNLVTGKYKYDLRIPLMLFEDGTALAINSTVYTTEREAREELKEFLELNIRVDENKLEELKNNIDIMKSYYEENKKGLENC